jgi:DNA ligase-1
MRLAELVEVSAALARTRSRHEKVDRLAACLRALAPRERRIGLAYLAGILPQGRIGLGYAALRDARAAPTASAGLELTDVDRSFDAIARASGAGSQRARQAELAGLLARATATEQDFLVRLVHGELRQGASEGLVVEGVARAAGVPASTVRRALMLAGDLPRVGCAALEAGEPGLARFRLALFRPVLPMLAQPAQDVEQALARLGGAAFEYKLDGARIQAHKRGDEVRVFSRSGHDVTAAVPEIVETLRALPASELVLDGEAIALAPDGRPRPFQVTMRRLGRRLEVERLRGELPLSTFFFDCLLAEGVPLLDAPAAERAERLSAHLPDTARVPRLVTAEREPAEAFFDAALRAGHEGLLAKALDAPYEAGGRGQSWLKLKRAHTLDLVVLAAEWGSGRRRGWLSNLHLGARDEATGGFAMIGKTFKGLSDELLRWQTERFLALEVARDDAYTVRVAPALVVEVAFGDVQRSPHYDSGVALRFARVRRYRPDKSPAEADTLGRVRALLPEL